VNIFLLHVVYKKYSMPVIRPYKGCVTAKKGVIRGKGVVLLDRNKPDMKQDEDSMEVGGGSVSEGPKRTVRKTNRVGGAFLQGPKARKQQHAILHDDRAVIKPFASDNSGDSSGAGLVPNKLKVPASLGKKKNNYNIKLVL
jgi:hypothetical protein